MLLVDNIRQRFDILYTQRATHIPRLLHVKMLAFSNAKLIALVRRLNASNANANVGMPNGCQSIVVASRRVARVSTANITHERLPNSINNYTALDVDVDVDDAIGRASGFHHYSLLLPSHASSIWWICFIHDDVGPALASALDDVRSGKRPAPW